LHVAQKRNADAVIAIRRGLEIERNRAIGPNGRWALGLLEASDILLATGNKAEAKSSLENAIPVLERELGASTTRVVDAKRKLQELTSPAVQSSSAQNRVNPRPA